VIAPVFRTDDFILKVAVAKVTEKLPEYLRRVGPDKGGFWEIIE
jgi:hypothetical protein